MGVRPGQDPAVRLSLCGVEKAWSRVGQCAEERCSVSCSKPALACHCHCTYCATPLARYLWLFTEEGGESGGRLWLSSGESMPLGKRCLHGDWVSIFFFCE